MSLTAVVFWFIYIGGLASAVFNPVVGVALYILVYHLNPETQWWGASVEQAGLRVSFTVALATAIGILVRQPRFEYGARQFPPSYAMALLLGGLAAASLYLGTTPSDYSYFQFEKLVKLLIFVFILIRCIRTPAHYHAVILSWIAGLLYLGYQAQGGAGLVIGGRLTGGLGGPDFAESSGLSVHLVSSLPLLGAMFFVFRSLWARGGILVIGALTVNTILMTRSRNAIPGLIAMTIVAVMALPKQYRLRGICAVVVGLMLAAHLADPFWWSRMNTIMDYKQDASATNRLEYWGTALEVVQDYPLGVGIGKSSTLINEYSEEITTDRNVHSTPISALVEMGWLGLIVFLGMFAAALRQLTQVKRMSATLPDFQDVYLLGWRSRFHLGWHAMALRGSLAAYFASGLFTTRVTSEDMWILLGLAACLHNVALYMYGEHHEFLEEAEEEVEPSALAAGQPDPARPQPDTAGPLGAVPGYNP